MLYGLISNMLLFQAAQRVDCCRHKHLHWFHAHQLDKHLKIPFYRHTEGLIEP